MFCNLFLSLIVISCTENDGDTPAKRTSPTDRLIGYLSERNQSDQKFRLEQLELEREKFEASKTERTAMLTLMDTMMKRMS